MSANENAAISTELNNSIFVGTKPFMNYVSAAIVLFTTKNAQEVVIKARGQCISRAVDLAETLKKRFLEQNVSVSKIEIDSNNVQNKNGKDVMVSSIEITLKKN